MIFPFVLGIFHEFPMFFGFLGGFSYPPVGAPVVVVDPRRFRVMDTNPEIWTSLMWCNFLRPVESRVYEEAKDKTKAGRRSLEVVGGAWRHSDTDNT